MSNSSNILLSIHVGYAVVIASAFFIILLDYGDELHQYSINKALKHSIIITVLCLLGYSLYMLVCGNSFISLHVLFFGIEGLSLLSLLFYYLELKGISFSIKIRNKKVVNFIITISIAIGLLSVLSIFSNFKLFSNPGGIVRYDTVIESVGIIFLSLLPHFLPNLKQKLNRDTYKKKEKEFNKKLNIIIAIYIICIILIILYAVYRIEVLKS